jgi:hypothetical protein
MNRIHALILSVLAGLLLFSFAPAYGETAPGGGEEELFSGAVKANVLIILDNSNSMDEDFSGNAVGSWDADSKAAAGKRVLNNLVGTYANIMRIGLMTHRLPSTVNRWYIANTYYFVSYEPKSFCENPPDACVKYCQTGDGAFLAECQSTCVTSNSSFDATYIDDSIAGFGYGTPERIKYCSLTYPKTRRVQNSTDPNNYVYYKQALPFYSGTDYGNHFDAAANYAADDNYPDYYSLYRVKTGTSDGIPPVGTEGEGYQQFWSSENYFPTDSDIALGYKEFGRRAVFVSVGRAFHANTSPGGGYLHVPVNDNQTNNQQRDAILAKLTAYEGQPDLYMDTCTVSDLNQCPYIINAGLTPTAGTLEAANSYFKGVYAQEGTTFASPIQEGAATCQKNFIVYVTDGLPSVNESGAVGNADALIPAVLDKLRALRNLGLTIGGKPYTYDIPTYIVGAGLTSEAKVKLDAMAVAGGTDVDGHAYYADNEAQLQNALSQIFTDIQANIYSFSLPSVSSVRFQDENYLYTASFDPKASDPLWKGHLKKIRIEEDGSLGSEVWDVGEWLAGPATDARDMRTLIGGSLTEFRESLISPTYFGLAASKTEERNQIVGYIRGKATLPSGGTELPNADSSRKLGDIFHGNPVTISSPSLFFNDPRDKNLAFDTFRKNHQRTSSGGNRIIVAGANDGQLHAFETGQGAEKWSFIPPSLLSKLGGLAHVSHPTTKKRQYFVDGPLSAADVWLPASVNDGTAKSQSEWRSLLVSGLGMGVRGSGNNTDYLWSKNPSCDGEFKDKHNPPYKYYCGYYAFDVTNTASYPSFKWTLNLQQEKDDGPYLGEPWSKMVMGRVKDGGNERWVGFIGGGYTMGTPSKADTGKGFFVVDLTNGTILWSYTAKDNNAMSFIPGTPAIVDKDSDGFIDTAYVGDLAGNLWKFTFCPNDPEEAKKTTKCGVANWTPSILYSSQASSLPTFNTPSVAKDGGYYWVFWGTGDKANPNILGSQDRFFAVRDDNPSVSVSYTLSNLQNITSGTFNNPEAKGWYVNLNVEERVLSDSTVYKGIVLFTSYTPPGGGNLCGATGRAALYGIAMMPVSILGEIYDPGKGVFSQTGQRRIDLGTGIPSAPVVSQKPLDGSGRGGTPDVFVGVSGGSGAPTETLSSANPNMGPVANALTGSGPSPQIIHWRDRRVQPY